MNLRRLLESRNAFNETIEKRLHVRRSLKSQAWVEVEVVNSDSTKRRHSPLAGETLAGSVVRHFVRTRPGPMLAAR